MLAAGNYTRARHRMRDPIHSDKRNLIVDEFRDKPAHGRYSSFSSYGYMLTLSKENFNIFLQEGHRPSYFLAMSRGDLKILISILLSYRTCAHSEHITLCGMDTSRMTVESYVKEVLTIPIYALARYCARARTQEPSC